MSLDFQSIRQQVRQLGESAPLRERRLEELRQKARALLSSHADELESLRRKVQEVVQRHDPSLRCALPVREPLTAHFPLPALPEQATILAADGSQIYLDRHSAVEYFLINVGVIQMRHGESQPAQILIDSDLYYGDQVHRPDIFFSEEKISLMRNVAERLKLAELAAQAEKPVYSLTDGPLELWGVKSEEPDSLSSTGPNLTTYLEALDGLQLAGASAAGFVDKPTEDYVVRLLEIASQAEGDGKQRPLFGVRDVDLFGPLLAQDERSAVFEFQSRFGRLLKQHNEAIALHFFYLNVGSEKHPWIVRVDFLGQVAEEEGRLNALHALLVHQCRVMGSRPYPYLLHRAHETALVSLEEKGQLEAMIAHELRKHGIRVEISHKQGLKNLPGKGRYRR